MASNSRRSSLESWELAGEKVGIDKRVHPHGLRHMHTTELIAEGLPLNARHVNHLDAKEVVEIGRRRAEW